MPIQPATKSPAAGGTPSITAPMPPAAFQAQVSRELAAVKDILTHTGSRLA